MVKITREQFIHILESGKYSKITGKLWDGTKGAGGQENCCTLGAILKETGVAGQTAAPGFQYLPPQLAQDLNITPAFESKIYGLNDSTGNDNFKAVIDFLRKEWDIPKIDGVITYDDLTDIIDQYFTSYYSEEAPTENYGYNT